MTKEELQSQISHLEGRHANLDKWWNQRLTRKAKLEGEKGIKVVIVEEDLLFKRDQVSYRLEELKKKLAAL
tara:strand:- start:120 stop:332 length:213 start_codon:yes stop_codon:yes gene_type:complete